MAERPVRALVIGRFQPPHRGHLACIRAAAESADEVVVVVGSAQRSHTRTDPFTAGERIEMLRLACQDEGIRVDHIIPVPDLDQYHLWVAHVGAHVPRYDLVVTGSPMTEYLFQQEGVRVERIPVREREAWSGTALRRRLLAGDTPGDAATPSVQAFLQEAAIRGRFRALAEAAEGKQG